MKSIYSFLAITAVSIAFASCAKEAQKPVESIEAIAEVEEPLVEVTLIAGNPEAQPATKTEISGSTPYWSVGDVIGVSAGTTGNYPFTTGIATRSTTASFTGSTVSGTLYAYYPYSADGIKTAAETTGARINLAKDQNPTATSFDGDADVMVAKSFEVDPENTTVENLEFARISVPRVHIMVHSRTFRHIMTFTNQQKLFMFRRFVVIPHKRHHIRMRHILLWMAQTALT